MLHLYNLRNNLPNIAPGEGGGGARERLIKYSDKYLVHLMHLFA